MKVWWPLMLNLMLICAIALFFNISPARGGSSTLDWGQVSSEFIEIRPELPPARNPLQRWILDRDFFKYDVGLESGPPVPEACQWQRFQEQNSTLSGWPLTEAYLKACEKLIQNGSTNPWVNTYRTLMISMRIEEHPYLRRVFYHLPNGFKSPGLLALKDTVHRRPLLIFRSGIFGNSQDILAERFLLMQLFEQGPFNVLFLDSLVSPETISVNTRYSTGGLDEGLQNYQVIRQIQNPKEPLSKLVSSVHFLGLSMGGHGMWLTLMLNQLNQKYVTNAVGICPLVQFEETFSSHARDPFFFLQINLWAAFRLTVFRERVAGMSIRRFLTDSFDWVANNYRRPLTEDGTIRFPKELQIKRGEEAVDFKQANRFLSFLDQVRIPTTVFSSHKDPIVPYDLNAKEIENMIKKSPETSIRVFPFHESVHCSFPGAYDWDQFSDLLIAQFDPKVKGQVTEKLVTPWKAGEVSRVYWPQDAGALKVELLADGAKREIDLPLGRIDWATGEKIRNWTEARALIRWARHNLRVVRVDDHIELHWPRLQ